VHTRAILAEDPISLRCWGKNVCWNVDNTIIFHNAGDNADFENDDRAGDLNLMTMMTMVKVMLLVLKLLP